MPRHHPPQRLSEGEQASLANVIFKGLDPETDAVSTWTLPELCRCIEALFDTEKAFFRINQGGTKIDPVEKRILAARSLATALTAWANLRGGTSHNYWTAFEEKTRAC